MADNIHKLLNTEPLRTNPFMANAETIQEKLQALQDNFAANLPAKLQDIETIWMRVRIDNQDKDISEIIFLCHKLAGAGTSFGFKNISDNARLLENALKDIQHNPDIKGHAPWDDCIRSTIESYVQQLISKENQQQITIKEIATKELKPDKQKKEQDEPLVVYIQEKNRLVVNELTSKFKTYRYNVRNFSSLEDLKCAIQDNAPDVVIIDSTLFNTQTKKILTAFKKKYYFKIIHLASTGYFNERLEAVRMGVDYYFTKPVDFSPIIDIIDSLSEKQVITSSKVLIVDDSISTSQFYALSLENVGIQTKVVTDPFMVMDELIDFKPELILLDLHMPKCSGLELAAVIRQQKNYISTPIIFLSAETNAQKQLETLEVGADEFLTKPVNVKHLIGVIKNKLARYHQLSAYMHNDSLTGLLNHTSIIASLDTEIARAKRKNSNLSYAMIDIDYFKKANDTYGHHMGDMVIKNLARFLKQSLRITDSVGRYGGEEFVAILPGIDATVAKSVIQKILDNFSRIEFVHFNHKFNVTFSCGITDYLASDSASEIIESADKALYVAKKDGRNCIRVTEKK